MVSTAAVIAGETAKKQAEIVSKSETEILKAASVIRKCRTEKRRAERVKKLAEVSLCVEPLSELRQRFPVIYCDPPWEYEHAESESRAIENHYPTLTLAKVKQMAIETITTKDCVLFLWSPSPKLAEALGVIEAWGFTYRTCMIWVKDKIGMGYYARQRHELLLIATKGEPPTPAPVDRPDSVVEAARGKHSEKPKEFYEIIERMYPALPKVELFCRSPRDGWVSWGNEVNNGEK